ncbi:MAG: 5-formyltetrahydrofolate cyclo-ligase [bacterium]
MTKDSKAAIRKRFLAKRDSLSPDEKDHKSSHIHTRLLSLDEYVRARTCLLYASFRNEVATDPLIPAMLQQGRRVALPITDRRSRGLLLYEITNGKDDLVVSTYGIREPRPAEHALIDPEEIDLFIVPGVAFDTSGTRLGFGGGYYDRLLSKVPGKSTIALAFEIQITSQLPCEPFDIKMKKIITERRVIDCKTYIMAENAHEAPVPRCDR